MFAIFACFPLFFFIFIKKVHRSKTFFHAAKSSPAVSLYFFNALTRKTFPFYLTNIHIYAIFSLLNPHFPSDLDRFPQVFLHLHAIFLVFSK